MTATGDPPRTAPPGEDGLAGAGRRRGAGAVHEVCPYLVAAEGGWRSAYASRDHRCGALEPPAPVAPAKQRQLCLVPAHGACATFLAARALAAETASPAPGDEGAALWPSTRSTPLVLEAAHRVGPIDTSSTRTGGQALLVGLMILAFLVLVVARTTAPSGSPTPSPLASPGASAAAFSPSPAAPSPSAAESPSPSPAAESPSPVATPSPTAAGTPSPSGSARYTVQRGDTLSGIAARFHTTVRAISQLNGITDPHLIRVGQVLIIP